MAFKGLRSTTPPTMPMNPEGLGRSPENTGSSYQEVPTSTVQPNPTYPWEPEGAVFGSRKLYFRI